MVMPVFGKMKASSLLSLRISLGLGVLLAWNVGFLYARRLGAPYTRSGLVVGGVCALAMGLLALAIVTIPSVRKLALHPSRLLRTADVPFHRLDLLIHRAWVAGCRHPLSQHRVMCGKT